MSGQKTAAEKLPLQPSLSTGYTRSVAGPDSSFYQSYIDASFGLSYKLPDQGNLSLSTGVSRDLDALEMENVWGSTSLNYGSRSFALPEDLSFSYNGGIVFPTNSEMRDYLSYRGSVRLGASLNRSWNAVPFVQSASLGLWSSASRSFFEYDASIAGAPNTLYSISSGVSAGLQLNNVFRLSSNYSVGKSRKANNTWRDFSYSYDVGASARLTNQLSVGISQSNQNRLYTYDAETLHFALYDYQTTVYRANATYTF